MMKHFFAGLFLAAVALFVATTADAEYHIQRGTKWSISVCVNNGVGQGYSREGSETVRRQKAERKRAEGHVIVR